MLKKSNSSNMALLCVVATAFFCACGDSDSPSSASQILGTITDSRDGKTYKTVSIGSQIWMAENLNYETANSFCYYNNRDNCDKYGRLYIWSAAMDSAGIWSSNGMGCGDASICSPIYPVQGACPMGWHLPTMVEFETLFALVGDQYIAGQMLKATRSWIDRRKERDSYSFSALAAGFRNDENFILEGHDASFWSSTEFSDESAYFVELSDYNDYADLRPLYKNFAFSVRCVKD